MKRVCLYPIKYRFHRCDFRKMLADGLFYCLCDCEECRECMERFSRLREELSESTLELLRQINLQQSGGYDG